MDNKGKSETRLNKALGTDQIVGDDPAAGTNVRNYFQQLRYRLILWLLIAFIPPHAALSFYFHFQFTNTLKQTGKLNLKALAESQKNTIDLFLQERVTNLFNLFHSSEYTLSPNQQNMESYLQNLRQVSDAFIDVGFLNSRGIQTGYAGPFPYLQGRDYSSEKWFETLMNQERGYYISDIYLGFRKKPHFTIATRQLIGGNHYIMRSTLDPDKFYMFLRSISHGKEVECALINSAGFYQIVDPNRGELLGLSDYVPPWTERPEVEEISKGGDSVLIAYVWLKETPWALLVRQPLKIVHASMYQTRRIMTAVQSFILLIIGAAIWLTTSKQIKKAEDVSQKRDDLQYQLVHASKLASVGELATGVAHEINNPLAIIIATSGVVRDMLNPEFNLDASPENITKELDIIDSAAFRARKITRQLLDLGRKNAPRLVPCNVNDILDEVTCGIKECEFKVEDIEVIRNYDPGLPAMLLDQDQIRQVFLNLINNAGDAISGQGTITISTKKNEKNVLVTITDTGSGMSPEQMKQIFNPFYTTKETGKGTGLGLSVSLSIVEAMGGTIDVQSLRGSGSFVHGIPANKIPKRRWIGMKESMAANENDVKLRLLVVDDEDRFREAISQQLRNRGFKVYESSNGEDAIKIVRHKNPEVVILDQKMPNMDGIQTLKELKKIRPEVQVIMHTGYGNIESARVTGKHDVFCYLEKPCDLNQLISMIKLAAEERTYALARHEIPVVKRSSVKEWLLGVQNARPGIIILGILLFLGIAYMPVTKQLDTFLTSKKTGEIGESISGYSDYRKLEKGQTIAEYYIKNADLYEKINTADGKTTKIPFSTNKVAFKAKVMVGVLVVAALFWATGAIPVGITALLVGVLMYFFGVLPPEKVAKAYAKDSVIFIFGVLAFAAAISKTGLDRRIGILLLGTSTNLTKFALIFAPLLSITAAFLSEHALVAFIAPILMLVYMGAIKSAGIKNDKSLVVMLLLMLTFCGNVGGPGSPAAGGRNAVMLGIFSDYGVSLSFGQWVKMGLPFVPVMAIVIACYFLVALKKSIKTKSINIAAEVKREAEKIGRMTADEYKAATVLVLLIVMWITMSSSVGMGGPVILALVLLNVLGILTWKDINSIHFDVVALYAAASAMGYGLATSGAALWLANAFVSVLPDFLKSGIGLCMSTSFITGVLTNFMSDGATVAAVGPITVPMATLSGTSPIMVGLATAFASSFAHMLIIGTPNNAIVFAIARDPETGEQLVTMKDFLVHGFAVFVLSMAVLWIWVFFGYWNWITSHLI